MSLVELSKALAEGKLTPSRAVEIALARIAGSEAELRAWVMIDADGARAAAKQLECSPGPRGPLWGVPVGIKDLIDVAGLPTGCGSPLRGAEPARRDADCVRLLRKAGAIIMGKTVTTEFGYFTPGPTRNPADLCHTPGGSSSGSAAAVAAGTVPLALGTQTAGSLTRPASFCGAAGLVAATGTFPLDGVAGLSESLDTLGFLASTVADLHVVWSALSPTRFSPETSNDDAPAHVLVWDGSGLGNVGPEMVAAVDLAAAALVLEGGTVDLWKEHDLLTRLAEAHAEVMAYEAAGVLAVELQQPHGLSQPLVDLLTAGEKMTRAQYSAAQDVIASGRRQIIRLLETHDAVLGPAAPGAAPPGLHATGSPVLSRPWQALGFPAITIPGLRDKAGMPLGVQLIGPPGREERLFSLAKRIETALPSPRTPILSNR
ncbi:Asp-tRNAAsn/Glu-tRNAGln amidotransferase A subunit [Arthrobacter sp. 31Cvi3.1E]|nr:Asp-tRNAAsn/Glu-tRNAGln amidotransferase A subunit [Arthrobacter sp. 31Cvi3.1E]